MRIFAVSFLLSLPFFWGINYFEKNLGDFLFWHEISQKPHFFTAQILLEEEWRKAQPFRNREAEELEIGAKSAFSIITGGRGEEKVLFEKESRQKLPIASLTKLMTAWVVLEYYDLSKEIKISKEAANQHGDVRRLEEGRVFSVEYLLYPLLIESSNGAAFALANDYPEMSEKDFVGLMNREAQEIGLENTFFNNPSGLDPEETEVEENRSTAQDMAKLAKKLLEEPLIWQILSLPRYSEYGPELINTNRFLLNNETNWQEGIVGGKTGYTSKAGGCLLLVVRPPGEQGFLINIILGAEGREVRFEEMKKLVDWLKIAYKW